MTGNVSAALLSLPKYNYITLKFIKMLNRDKKVQPSSANGNAAKLIAKCRCPLCSSTDINEVEKRTSNGVIGPGRSSRVEFSYMACSKCGVMFQKVKGNGI
jgi:hypothetical protein